ncbi:MAG: nicotinate-nucleotide--dimethylbenzimidazole phosphoribosyltransferase, partial [Actinomycetota bacterium]
MNRISEVISKIEPLDAEAMRRARERQDQLTKPQGSLGVLEELSIKIAGITGKAVPEVGDKAIIVMAADHGVVEEGVSAYPREVTPQMVLNFAHGGAGINVLARHVGARVIVVDVGVAQKIEYQERAPSEVEGFSTSSNNNVILSGAKNLTTSRRTDFASREAQGSSRQACLERGR